MQSDKNCKEMTKKYDLREKTLERALKIVTALLKLGQIFLPNKFQ